MTNRVYVKDIIMNIGDDPVPITHIMRDYGCSHKTAYKVYKAKGWKVMTKAEQGELTVKFSTDIIAKYLKVKGKVPVRRLQDQFKVSRQRALKAYKKAGIEPPSRVEAKKLSNEMEVWPQSNDAMNGMESIMGLRSAWR